MTANKVFQAIALCVVLNYFMDCGSAARILAIFPTPSISHQVVFRGLTLALNKRGHELVVITTDPVKDPTLKNYREIDLNYLYDSFGEIDFVGMRRSMNWPDMLVQLEAILHHQTRQALENPEVKKLHAPENDEKFDVVLMELLFWQALTPLVTRFNAPLIGMVSMAPSTQVHYRIGNPILSNHPSVWELDKDIHESPTLWRRLKNFVNLWKYLYYFETDFVTKQQKMAEEFFGEDIPDVRDIEKNVSLILVDQQTPISPVRANLPKIVQFGGFHVSKKVQTLPKDLKKILDEAKSGFVYMSLGTNVKSKLLSNETRGEFMTAFSKVPYKVLWKFEDDELPGKPDNVVIMKWTPQQAVLAHPNLKVFVYQGGLQSTEEAIHHGVPLIGLPTMGDQDMNVNKMVSLGVAKKIEITTLRSEELVEAITTIAPDESYKKRMSNLRSLLGDKPNDAMETAIWWTEHVIRHRGAPQLHSTVADEPWYRRYDMDLIAIVSAGSVIVLQAFLFISYKFLVYGIRLLTKVSVANEKKKRS
ncbi:UDP-glucosyltransferase 2-like [Athalia rosae]|uniref:UDP-glucosyltransferase 2-like n=1 Tax=Athalia rosae TaxID=37344 RepID=UPI002033CF99|nr:UDP-glucosyltransferase 2-like [Athalia rosae]